MSRGPDAGVLLVRALIASAEAAGIAVSVVDSALEGWASATFTGARHRIVLQGEGRGFDGWLATLPDAEFALRRHLVAELVLERVQMVGGWREAELAALTVEEG